MTTSGETAWSMTARDVVKVALQDNRIIALGVEPEAAELAACIVRLNGMLKSWQAKGVTMWRQDNVEVTFAADEATVTLPIGISNIIEARLAVSATYQRPMTPLTRSEYNAYPNKAQSGQPLGYYFAQEAAGATLTVWPVPTATTTINVDAGRVTETVTDADETIDIPEMWQEAVYSNLAVRILGIFTDRNPGDELVQRARSLEAQLFDYDRPDSYQYEAMDEYRA